MRGSLVLIALVVAMAAPVFGQSIVVPNRNATVAGNDTSGPLPASPVSVRAQTVIDPGQFPGLGPITITGFSLGRAAPGTGALNVSITGNIYLSTSPNWANSSNGHPLLSTTFAANVGADNTLVMSPNNFMVTEAGCAPPGPCPFANNVVFTTPFLYNPANGPLLIDLQLTAVSSSGAGQFDVQDCPNTSCVVNGVDDAPLGSATGIIEASGSVMQITYSLASAQCETFTDVAGAAAYCPAVQWLKNRQVTTGCAAGMYCPNDSVTRAAMALFMNRLGKALSPEILYRALQPGPVTVQNAPPFGIYCQTSDSKSTFEPLNHPTAAVTTATFSGLADSAIAWRSVIVYSDDGGATWNQVPFSNAHRASAAAGEWSEITNVAATPVAPGAVYRAGILIAREPGGSTGNFTDSRCQIVVTIHNANAASPPY